MSWKREPLDDDELDRLLEAASGMDLDHEFTVRTLAHTGLRADEFAHLRSEWIDWQHEHLRVPAEADGWTPKTDDAARTVPIRDPDTLRVMREFFKRNEAVGVTRKAIYERVVRVAEQTDLRKRVTPHVLRHTYGTLIARNGATAQFIRQTMGHADLSSANDYIECIGRQLADEADDVWGD
ncbi:tyrosine-type recombinase/integrase [Halorhabdus rudnickae]|uniref:tyrosine-type recombinase/integrase n=1 Tax=Halorhabdus rudnickae TaxID=1775544 RepID=UPI0010827B4A|nr:site-specific integrase [Halorhabdus rudnickae]